MRVPLPGTVSISTSRARAWIKNRQHGNVLLIVANVVAENFPIGITLGVMALRARSLVLPAVVHISLDTMKDLVI